MEGTPKIESGSATTKKILNKKTLTIFFVIAGIITITVATYSYLKYQLDKVMDYCYKLTKLKIDKITLREMKFTVYLKIRNKSDLDINIKSQNYLITVNGSDVSYMNSTTPTTVKGKQSIEIPFVITFDPMEVLKISLLNIDQFLLDKESIKIGIKGTFKGGSSFVSVNYPVDYEYTIKELLADTGEEDCWKDG